jgi:putative hydrolase of the HAD superfamily
VATAKATAIDAAAVIHALFADQKECATAMAAQRNRAILLDALGTLLTFEAPGPHLRAELRQRLGVDVGERAAAEAIAAEIRFYRAHLHEGRDAAGLAALRRACAEAMRPALPEPAASADGELLTGALLGALRFRAYPDAAPALRELRAAGLRLVVLSNWDASLHERLAETGLAALVDGAVASAELGVAKPDPRAFAAALAVAGAEPSEAVHVGDSPDADVAGALAAGLRAVLVVRAGDPPAGVPVVRSLAELPLTLGLP